MNDNQVRFYPFNVINEYMLPEFRQAVITKVFQGADKLSGPSKGKFGGLVRKFIQIPGFRNSALAPLTLKVRAAIGLFASKPEFSGAILQTWAELNSELRKQVFDLLTSRGWEILPDDANRSALPGFQLDWPKEETYDTLGEAFKAAYPDATVDDYYLRLMAVWISGRLPNLE